MDHLFPDESALLQFILKFPDWFGCQHIQDYALGIKDIVVVLTAIKIKRCLFFLFQNVRKR